jgi:outer membrane protein OmpA-like peptidoglycan-associated protein
MKIKTLLFILPLMLISLSFVWAADDIHLYGENEDVNPDDIANMLGGTIDTSNDTSYMGATRSLSMIRPEDERSNKTTSARTNHSRNSNKSRRGKSKKFGLPINFASGSATLTSNAKRQLRAVARGIKRAGVSVVIEGHTDAAGSEASNLRLSWQRANAVKTYLSKSCGINRSAIIAIGKGEQDLIYPNEPYSAKKSPSAVSTKSLVLSLCLGIF